jgi:rhamnosyl/mannosyltransferase
MKVLHVFKTAYPFTQGGLEESIRQICLHGAAGASRVDVACIGPQEETVEVREAGYARLLAYPAALRVSTCPVSLRMLRPLWRWMDAYDVVHFHVPWPFAEFAAVLRPGGRAKRVVTYHADIVNREPLATVYRPMLRRMLDGCDAVVATSEAYIDTSPVLARLRRRPHVIPLGIDEASYPAPDPGRVAAWRARLGQGIFLFLGVLRYYKGLDTLAAASRDLGVPTVIVGDGPERARLAARAEGRDDLICLGYVSDEDKMALLQLARAVVLPSTQRAEAFGIALLEGAMAACALISTRLGTGTDVVNRHEETGLVVPPGDVGALAGAMRRLRDEPATAAAFGRAARARFEARYTGREMGRAYGELYAALLAGSREVAHVAPKTTAG